jgi:hypothetical protein
MPFRPLHLWKFERARADALAEEVDRLAADSRMHRLFEWFTRHQREISDFQLEVTAIPAPPFGEQPRAILLSERLAALGVAPELDDAGNLLAQRERSARRGDRNQRAHGYGLSRGDAAGDTSREHAADGPGNQ